MSFENSIESFQKRINSFVKLGDFLSQFKTSGVSKKDGIDFNDIFFDIFSTQIKRAKEYNGWFSDNNVLFSLESWADALTLENLTQWTNNYILQPEREKTIAIIMAGNIPLVGLHDFISVLISGNRVLAKLSSNDKIFIPLIAKYLEHVEPSFKGKIQFTDDQVKEFDAVIATGSDNSARYFEYYFGKHPSIIRKNRNSVAVLTGDESEQDLEKLGEDIFRYYGLGCRNVSKLLVPKDYDFDKIFKAIYKYNYVIDDIKYKNNYDYNKAVYLMSLFKLVENGFLMLKEDTSYSSPIATLFFEYYEDENQILQKLDQDKEKIQCIVGNQISIENQVNFGETQRPQLWDYADGVDTLNFLSNL